MPVDRTTAVDALKEATRTLQATEHEMLADERRAFRIRQLVGLMMAAEAAPPPESRDATSTVGLGPELRLIFERAADQAGLRRPLSERNQNRLARVVAGVFYDSRQSSPPRPEMAAIVRASVLQFQLESAQTASRRGSSGFAVLPRARPAVLAAISAEALSAGAIARGDLCAGGDCTADRRRAGIREQSAPPG